MLPLPLPEAILLTIVILIGFTLPSAPFVLPILLGPSPAEKEQLRRRCCHDHACCHTHPAKRQANLAENPLC